LVLTAVVAASTLMSASAASTTKSLSSNFTLVNLVNGANNIQSSYIKSTGAQWRDPENTSLNGLGAQLIRRQYDDTALDSGSGSVVVSSDGPVGAVVQILTRGNQVATSGAYVGVSEGATSANVPLVQRKRNTASGISNSQVIVQNASNSTIDVDIDLIDGTTGAKIFTHHITGLTANASAEYDLADETAANVPDGWFGSANVHALTAGGEVAVVSNLFNGPDTMQTFNAFTTSKTKWGIPLFAVRLANSLSTPVAVQNVGATTIPANAVTLSCTKDPAAPGQQNISFKNAAAIGPNQSAFFNPVTDLTMPALWFGACNLDSGAFQTAVFVQLRTLSNGRAGAHEGIALDGTDKVVVIPLYAKRLTNGFASAVTILNLSASDAHVHLDYKAGDGAAANCVASFDKTIPGGGSLIQNHRLATTGTPSDNPNSVPQLPSNCFGTLTVTSSDQPINAFVQLDLLDDILGAQQGDPFQAHNAFTVAAAN
jgi:hypothetical protein